MIVNGNTILQFAFIALSVSAAFLIFLNQIPRWWRLGIYLLCTGFYLIIAHILYVVASVIGRNVDSGIRAQHFFESLQQQLASGTVHQEFLELPGYASGVILTLLAAASIMAGAVFAWRKIRWYSWFVLIFAFIMTQFAFSVCIRAEGRKSIEDHNEMRHLFYGLIEQKRTEGVTDRQMADSVAENLKEFHFCESRRAEIESEKRIEDALKNLRRITTEEIR